MKDEIHEGNSFIEDIFAGFNLIRSASAKQKTDEILMNINDFFELYRQCNSESNISKTIRKSIREKLDKTE